MQNERIDGRDAEVLLAGRERLEHLRGRQAVERRWARAEKESCAAGIAWRSKAGAVCAASCAITLTQLRGQPIDDARLLPERGALVVRQGLVGVLAADRRKLRLQEDALARNLRAATKRRRISNRQMPRGESIFACSCRRK